MIKGPKEKIFIQKSKPILLLTFLFISICVHAQNPKIDSLKKVLLTAREDSSKVKTQNNLTLELDIQGSYDSAISSATTALLIARKIGYAPGEAMAQGDLGIVHYEIGNYPESMKHNTEAPGAF